MEGKYLPIGSIVKLNDNNKKMMIIGYYSLKYQNSVKIYDYCGCVYPEGMLLSNNLFSFNHQDIAEVLFIGFKSEEYDVLNGILQEPSVDNSKITKKENFVNFKYDDNGVVIYDETEGIKVNPAIYERLNSIEVKNPFENEMPKVSESAEPQVFDGTEGN